MSTLTKVYKIMRSQKWALLLQFAIFAGIAIAVSIWASDGLVEEFTPLADAQIAIFDRDDTDITRHFIDHFSDVHELVAVADDRQVWEEAIDDLYLIIEIPAGFTDSLIAGDGEISAQFLVNQLNVNAFLVSMQIERYFTLLSTYLVSDFDVSDALVATSESLAQAVVVEVPTIEESQASFIYMYYRFLPMTLPIMVAMATGAVFLSLNKEAIVHRLNAAPQSARKFAIERIGASVIWSLLIWVVFNGLGFILYGSEMLETISLLRMAGALTLVFLGIAFAFILSQFVEKREMLNTVIFSVIFPLIMLGGVTFDLAIMGETILTIARFTPFYWYTRLGDMLFSQPYIDWTLFWQSLAIQLSFAIAIVAAGLMFSKERRQKQR